MSDATPPSAQIEAEDKTLAYVIYVLYLVGWIAGGLAFLIGVVLAYFARRRAQELLLVSHYTLQIRTFWIGLTGLVVVIFMAIAILLVDQPFRVGAMVPIVGALLVVSIGPIIVAAVGVFKLHHNVRVLRNSVR